MLNIRINIDELIKACKICCIVGEVKVVAAGSLYATLETSEEMRRMLAVGGISWMID